MSFKFGDIIRCGNYRGVIVKIADEKGFVGVVYDNDNPCIYQIKEKSCEAVK